MPGVKAATASAPVSSATSDREQEKAPHHRESPREPRKTDVRGWSSVTAVSLAEEMNPTCRNTMEDGHCVEDQFAGIREQGLFAVFDGHGGRGVVDYLTANFAQILAAELETPAVTGGQRPVIECLTSAFLIADVETCKEGLMLSGATAAVCLVRPEGDARVLYSANVGDARVVLCRRGGQAQRLSYDHKATDESEAHRVTIAGGFILRKRVMGILSVTRSFGDHAMKTHVIGRPHVETATLDEGDEFCIIACDGVW
jgi:serine/threonine protein phosphatase PrpC